MGCMDEKSERYKEPFREIESLNLKDAGIPKILLEDAGIPKEQVEMHENCIEEGPIRERFEKLYSDEEFKEIINFEEIKKGELYVNIIHYDKDIRKEENMKYYRYFSIDTIGGYYPFDDFLNIILIFLGIDLI